MLVIARSEGEGRDIRVTANGYRVSFGLIKIFQN